MAVTRLNDADKRQDKQGDHDCADDVNNAVHGNYLSLWTENDTAVPLYKPTFACADSFRKPVFRLPQRVLQRK
jgi:hypothetical protein